MKNNDEASVRKIRQNISIDPEVRDLLRHQAKIRKTTISGLITRWVIESGEFSHPTLVVGDDEDQQRKAK